MFRTTNGIQEQEGAGEGAAVHRGHESFGWGEFRFSLPFLVHGISSAASLRCAASRLSNSEQFSAPHPLPVLERLPHGFAAERGNRCVCEFLRNVPFDTYIRHLSSQRRDVVRLKCGNAFTNDARVSPQEYEVVRPQNGARKGSQSRSRGGVVSPRSRSG